MIVNRVFKREQERRAHLQAKLIEFWDNLILFNTSREDTEKDLSKMVTEYIENMTIDQLEDDCLFLDLPEYED